MSENAPATNGIDPGKAIDPPVIRRVKKKTRQKRSAAVKAKLKANLPPLNVVDAALEACRHAQEGNAKLASIVDILREGLQTISMAEFDYVQKREVLASELRQMARETLNLCGFTKPVVRTRAGKADGDLGKNRGNDGDDYD